MVWLDDGSDKTHAEGNAVCVLHEAKGDSKANALWKGDGGGVASGVHYWQFRVLRGSGMWVGVTTEAAFGQGYRCRGAMYGGPGNTSDGAGLVTSKFGDEVKEGDTLGLLLSVIETPERTISVSFVHNGRSLGEAFRFCMPDPEPIYPVVGLHSSPDKVSIQKAEPPVGCKRAPPVYEGPEGFYRLQSCTHEDGSELLVPHVTMELQARRGGLGVHVSAGNSLNGMLRLAEDGKWQPAGPFMCTMMMVEETVEVERFIISLFDSFASFESSESTVVFRGGGGSAIFCRADAPIPPPCDRNVFA